MIPLGWLWGTGICGLLWVIYLLLSRGKATNADFEEGLAVGLLLGALVFLSLALFASIPSFASVER